MKIYAFCVGADRTGKRAEADGKAGRRFCKTDRILLTGAGEADKIKLNKPQRRKRKDYRIPGEDVTRMEWDFRYLQGKYGDAGARAKFEEICLALITKEYPDLSVHTIRPEQGDGGIDILIGDFSEPIHVFQCKFFLGKIGDSQKEQIRKSFRTARENPNFTMKQWTLLIPVDLSQKEMLWWSEWKEPKESPDLAIDYLGQSELIARLREHELYNTYFDDSDKEAILQQLDKAVSEMRERLLNPVLNWRGASGLQYITCKTVEAAAEACGEKDVQAYYRINNQFSTMFRVICAAQDVPHRQAEEQLLRLLESRDPIIITGSGGRGKSSLMLRTAVLWARRGKLAVWLRLSAGDILTEAQAGALFEALARAAAENGPLLLCIDNPFEGRVSFQALQQAWRTDAPIRLLLAERNNRLSILTDQAGDTMLGWFDGANVIELGGGAQGDEQFRDLGWAWYPVPEGKKRQRQILEKAVEIFSAAGSLSEEERKELVGQVLEKYRRRGVSLAELIYRALFAIGQARVSKSPDMVLDWEEWDRFLRDNLSFESRDSYELIAAYKLFDTPLPLSLFCRLYRIDQPALERALERRRMEEQTEPVVYSAADGSLQPKHDVIAELYFLFHGKGGAINPLMRRVLAALDGEETELLLDQLVDKQELLRGSGYALDIDYRAYLNLIRERAEAGQLAMGPGGWANLCLGRLWLERNAWQKRTPEAEETDALRRWLREKAPILRENLNGRDRRGMCRLYTEWGIWERESGCLEAAEQRFIEALTIAPKDIPSRTELGRLLARDPGRRKEAELLFREALEIEPNNVPIRTELGRLLALDPARRKDAERVFRDAIGIAPKDVLTRTELGRLLALDPARRKEAEQLFRDAIGMAPKDVPIRTELGRLLALDPARRKEAELLFREALEIEPNNVPIRTELGRLLALDPARRREAEQLFRKALEIEPKNVPPRTELGRLLAQDPARRKEAERVFRKALEIDPKNVPIRTELGRLLARDPARPKEAERVFREALEIEPKNVQIRTELGRLLARDPARRKEAETVLKDVNDHHPRNIPSRDILARMYEKQKRYAEASALYAEILKIKPGDRLAKDGLKWVQAQLEKNGGA